MTEPRVPHLLDPESADRSTGEASDLVRLALRRARADVPDAARMDALSRSIAAAVTAPPPGGGSGGEGPGGAAGGAGGPAAIGPGAGAGVGAGKVAIGALVAVGVVAAAVLVLRVPTETKPTATAAPSTVVAPPATMRVATASPAVVAPEAPSLDVHALPSANVPSDQGRAADRAPVDSVAEMRMLEAAQAALASAPSSALAACEEHARTYPRGALAEEREVLAVDALLRLGRRSAAEERAARFRAAHPASAHVRRLEALLAPHSR